MGVGKKNPPRPRPANVPKRAGEGSVAEAITDLQVAVRRLEGKPEPEEAEAFVLEVLPVPPAIAAVQEHPDGAFSTNRAAAPIQDLYVVNLHASGTSDTHGPRFVQMPAHLGGIVTGTPIYFTSGKGVGSGAGACAFYSNMPQLRRGSRILSVSVRLHRTVGAGTSQIVFKRVANSPVTLGTASSISAPGGDLDLTISGLTETVGAATSYTMEVTLPQSQDAFQTVTIEYDRP